MTGFSPADLARAGDVGARDVTEVIEQVTEAVSDLERLYELDTVEHVAVFESIQQVLSETLSTVDDA